MTTMTSVTVRVPLTIRRRGGRKMIISPDGMAAPVGTRTPADVATTRGDPALVKALARAFRWRRMLEEGRYASIRELAIKEAIDRAYVGRVLNLTLLAPGIVEDILDGRDHEYLTLANLTAAFPVEWEQQVELCKHARPCILRPSKP